SDASLTLWDLRVLEVPLLLARPLGLAVPVHLSAVRALAGDSGLPPRVRDSLRFLECLLRYRFRYDIVVDDLPGVRPGDFEIAVGGRAGDSFRWGKGQGLPRRAGRGAAGRRTTPGLLSSKKRSASGSSSRSATRPSPSCAGRSSICGSARATASPRRSEPRW